MWYVQKQQNENNDASKDSCILTWKKEMNNRNIITNSTYQNSYLSMSQLCLPYNYSVSQANDSE